MSLKFFYQRIKLHANTIVMNNTYKMLIAFAAGAVAGTVLSLLYAPKSGAETRKNIRNQGKKFANAVQNTFRDTNGKIDELKAGVRHSFDPIKDKVMG